jgi:hypothetical protein
MRMTFIAMTTMLAGSSAAFAQSPAEPIDAAKLDADSKIAVGLDARFGRMDEEGLSFTGFAFELNGRVPVAEQLLLEVRFPFEHTSVELNDESESGTGIGNLQLGARWVGKWIKGPDVLRLGVGVHGAIPTATDEDEGGAANAIVSFFYMPALDLARYLPNAAQIGLDLAPRLTHGPFFVQAEVDLDFLLLEDADDVKLLYLRLVAGAAVTPEVTLMAAFHNVINLDADDNEDGDFNALAVGTAIDVGQVELTAHVYLPLDDFADPWGLGLGVAARF